MKNQKKLLHSDIRYECEDSAYEQGKAYYEQGRVLELVVKSEGALFVQLNATVKGNGVIPYKQNIRIVWKPNFSASEITGNCTCPNGYNCKHVAAVCLKYLERSQAPNQAATTNCLDWLASLATSTPAKTPDNNEVIIFVLKPGKNVHEVIFDLIVTKHKKNGGLHKGRRLSLSNLRYSYSYMGYVQPEDTEIAKISSALSLSSGLPILSGAAGHLALSHMLKTGRLYWHANDQAPISLEQPTTLSMGWQTTENGDYTLKIEQPEHVVLIFTEPAFLLNTKTLTLSELSPPCPSTEQLKKFLQAPVIPAAFAEEFSQKLLLDYPNLPLPAPKPLHIKDLLAKSPRPQLTLFGASIAVNQYLHLIKLRFHYEDYCLAGLPEAEFSVSKAQDGSMVRIQRNLPLEQSYSETLLNLGFARLPGSLLALANNELIFYSPGEQTKLDSAKRWGYFLSDVRDELEQQHWEVIVDDSFHLRFENADYWEAEFSENENNWFEMRFNIEIDGQSYALLPLITSVLEHYDLENLPEHLYIPLTDHTYLNLPTGKLKPVINVLYEMFNGNALAQDGSLRLSLFHAASIADLEQHSYGLFAIKGSQQLRELAQKLKDFSGIQTVPPPVNFHAELRPYQQHGLNWLQFLREYQFGGILADDMGLGKTIQTLSHLLLEKQSGRMQAPCLIIAPTSLMSNWRREAQRFTPDLSVLVLQGVERKQLFSEINSHDLVLTTYPLLPRDEENLLEQSYYYLILDEAQTIKNPLAKAAQLVRQIKSTHRLCLTGTPMENHLGELWAQFDFLMPGFLGNLAHFKKLYRTPIESYGDGDSRKRLAQRVAPFMLRRTKQEVATELPEKTEIIRSVPLYPKQAALYESIRITMEQRVRDAIAQQGLSRSHITILDALLKLRQTCCDPRTLSLKEAQKVKESAKLDLLMELLPEQLEEGRRILVFSQFTRMIALIEHELNAANIAYAKLTGQTKKRDDAINAFKNGEVNVFLISLKAGGVGLNLTEADTVIIYDPWWNPAAETQAADRAYRIGQDKPVFVYKLITENTVEEKIISMQEKKKALAQGIYQAENPENGLQLSAEDLTALFEPI